MTQQLSQCAQFGQFLSTAMSFAGFAVNNARLQSGLATASEEMLRLALKTDSVFVFGSSSDGWGSCLRQLDGKVEADSDIDITIILDVNEVHMPATHLAADDGVRCRCGKVQAAAGPGYCNGHVVVSQPVHSPSLEVPISDFMCAIDVLAALPCCGYPHIELLESGRKSNISDNVMEALTEELRSPRCHAVAASPPKLEGMRVSTTLMERILMRSLTTIQGQFFIILKFLIKKVLSRKVKGLKTYVAKNLLFYMLDETPPERWVPENLMELVRQSLQLLVAMMESSSGDDVCMTHFFLRDAAIYLKKVHDRKPDIIKFLGLALVHLCELLTDFMLGMRPTRVDVVQFHTMLQLTFVCELIPIPESQYEICYDACIEAFQPLRDEIPTGVTDSEHLQQLMQLIDRIPDCNITKRCLKELASAKVGRLVDLPGKMIFGIRVPADRELSVEEAAALVLSSLVRLEILSLELTPDGKRIARFPMLQDLLGGMADGLKVLCSGAVSGSVESPGRCDPIAHTLQVFAFAWPALSSSRLLAKLFRGRDNVLERLVIRMGRGSDFIAGILSGVQLPQRSDNGSGDRDSQDESNDRQ